MKFSAKKSKIAFPAHFMGNFEKSIFGHKFHSKMTKFRSRTKMFEGTVHDSDKAPLHSQANPKSANNQQS